MIEIQAPVVIGRTLGPPNGSGIPIGAGQDPLLIGPNWVNQDHNVGATRELHPYRRLLIAEAPRLQMSSEFVGWSFSL